MVERSGIIQMLRTEITVKHPRGLHRCTNHHRRCGRRDRARHAGKTAPAASKGKLPPVVASPKSPRRGERKNNQPLAVLRGVDSIPRRKEDPKATFRSNTVLLFFLGDDFLFFFLFFKKNSHTHPSLFCIYKQTLTPRRRQRTTTTTTTRSRSIKCQKT